MNGHWLMLSTSQGRHRRLIEAGIIASASRQSELVVAGPSGQNYRKFKSGDTRAFRNKNFYFRRKLFHEKKSAAPKKVRFRESSFSFKLRVSRVFEVLRFCSFSTKTKLWLKRWIIVCRILNSGKKNLQPEKLLKNGLFVSDEDNEADDVTGCSDLYSLSFS